jgi:hypothetical protein
MSFGLSSGGGLSGDGPGSVNAGTAGQVAYYATTGSAVSGNANLTISSGALTVGVSGSVAGSVLYSGSSSGVVTVQGAAAAGTWSLTLPTSGGSTGQFLQTNGYGTTTWASALSAGTTATLTVGYTFTPNSIGTVTSGTVTPNPALGNYQYLTNGGAFTMAVPGSDCAIDILITNNGSAGSITFTGYTVPAAPGSPFDTTNGHAFLLSIRRINGVSTYSNYALQ